MSGLFVCVSSVLVYVFSYLCSLCLLVSVRELFLSFPHGCRLVRSFVWSLCLGSFCLVCLCVSFFSYVGMSRCL